MQRKNCGSCYGLVTVTHVDIFKPPTEVSKPKGEDYSKPIIPEGIIKRMSAEMMECLKSIPENVALFASEVLLSSCCFNVVFWTGVGDLQPNIWNQIIMASGSGKSVPLNYWIYPILEEVEKNDPKHPLIMSNATPESITRIMNWHKETNHNVEPEADDDDKKSKKK